MGVPSTQASNAIIYLTYGAFLVTGLYIAWRLRTQSKGDFLSSNRTQKAIPLALNFIASALGSGILFSYPEIATICGVQGVVIYALSSSLPLLVFGFLGPIIRKNCPEGFVLTEWTRRRYGVAAALLLSVCTLITLFLYMVAELSALQQIVTALTGLDGLPAVIVECVVTTIYTSLGGFRVSFVTDNIQGAMVLGLIIIAVITIGVETHVDRSLIGSSGFLDASLLGWQLVYILPVAIFTNDFFISGFWLRTFASRDDKALRLGTSIATIVVCIILTFVGVTGLLSAWSGAWPGPAPPGYNTANPDDPANLENFPDYPPPGSLSFFLLIAELPAWVVGIVLCMVVALSTAAFDSFQSAMVSTASNDLVRNKLGLWWVRAAVVLIIIPVIVVALRSPDILTIYLISDLVSAALVPVLCVGLWEKMYFWRGFEVVVGGLGGILSVFIFGCIYYGNATDGGNLLLLEGGLYANNWAAFGAFVAAPVGGMLFGIGGLVLRLGFLWGRAKWAGTRFEALDRPAPMNPGAFVGGFGDEGSEDGAEDVVVSGTGKSGKFF
ncbi:hypothetical protein K402DRAFT_339522 [Aulographum hederae CBS 113979]|uniref:Urea transporter n=1 Tax=Aulographum hederae CBS 113979 TaxID=1176131 RepID=A0A6G1GQ14_9PEZI|nr:hypothetical protein K402DRAFT_339522 [Aulographum hederae CBS 113979]